VEWGELAASVFGRDVLTVTFELDDDEGRTLVVDGKLAKTRASELDGWARA
jgi:hypothetical protein